MDGERSIMIENERVYISGRMGGLTREQWRKNFNDAELELILIHGYHPKNIINPAKLIDIFQSLDYGTYLNIDLCLVDGCETIYMLNDWMESKGAKMEYCRARSKGKKIMFQEQNTTKVIKDNER